MKMTGFGRNKIIRIDDQIDRDGEVELIMDTGYEEISEWIDKAQAQAIIAHLQRVFGLGADHD
jgi:hypothetical protein